MSKSAYDYTLYGPDTAATLRAKPPKLERLIARLPGLQEVTSDLQIKTPRVNIVLDRDRAAALNLNWNTISQHALRRLRPAVGPPPSTRPPTSTACCWKCCPQYQEHTDGLNLIYLKSRYRQLVPLDARGQTGTDAGPQTIPHSGQLPSVTISFALKPGISLGAGHSTRLRRPPRTLPATITGAFQGTAKVFQDSMQNMGLLLIVAIAVVYIVLGVLYESYVHPLTILSGLPSAGFGALLTLILFKVDLSIYSFVGLIMLIGIVKKNAIMQIDFALEAERKEGKTPDRSDLRGLPDPFPADHDDHHGGAARRACRSRSAWAPAAKPRQPLGLAVVGGLAFSQLMTLISDAGGLYIYGGNS